MASWRGREGRVRVSRGEAASAHLASGRRAGCGGASASSTHTDRHRTRQTRQPRGAAGSTLPRREARRWQQPLSGPGGYMAADKLPRPPWSSRHELPAPRFFVPIPRRLSRLSPPRRSAPRSEHRTRGDLWRGDNTPTRGAHHQHKYKMPHVVPHSATN